MMRLHLGYPDGKAERDLLRGRDRREMLAETDAIMSAGDLSYLQHRVDGITVADALLDYLQDLLQYSRNGAEFRDGLSPRAGLAILRCARAWALMHGRDHVLPEDIQTVLPSVIGHRLTAAGEEAQPRDAARHLLDRVPVP
jgi:MoxR-like ATPase